MTLIPTPVYSIMQINPITNPNINMVAKNALVSQPSDSALRSAQAIPKVFYSRWGFGVIDFSSSTLGPGTMPDCQVGGGVNPNLNNYNYNYNFNYNNNNNIIPLASPEIAVISNFQSNNMIGVGQPGQPFPTFQQIAPPSVFGSQASPQTASLQQPIRSVKVMLPNGFLDEPTIIQALQLQPGTYSVVSNNCIVDTLQVPFSSASSPQIQPAPSSAASLIPPPVPIGIGSVTRTRSKECTTIDVTATEYHKFSDDIALASFPSTDNSDPSFIWFIYPIKRPNNTS